MGAKPAKYWPNDNPYLARLGIPGNKKSPGELRDAAADCKGLGTYQTSSNGTLVDKCLTKCDINTMYISRLSSFSQDRECTERPVCTDTQVKTETKTTDAYGMPVQCMDAANAANAAKAANAVKAADAAKAETDAAKAETDAAKAAKRPTKGDFVQIRQDHPDHPGAGAIAKITHTLNYPHTFYKLDGDGHDRWVYFEDVTALKAIEMKKLEALKAIEMKKLEALTKTNKKNQAEVKALVEALAKKQEEVEALAKKQEEAEMENLAGGGLASLRQRILTKERRGAVRDVAARRAYNVELQRVRTSRDAPHAWY